MRIKRVEIIGFKSFCDRAVVQIGEQITGVVGPNGCGKSNIVDAIRWCMGEQSAKHLRGKAMEDVIFAGSESRGPAPMAEVSLTFDDVGFSHENLQLGRQTLADERELAALTGEEGAETGEGEDAPQGIEAPAEPQTTGTWMDAEGNKIASPVEEVQELLQDKPPAFEFSHYTEVTITRRLYRDGISQYFINKSPCRLRDITDFFLGTGVGTKAYAIIEQGRIGQIVSARPQDRRAIIEEAAGITKFKSKKKAAERKLDQTRQNLMRVSDIVSELDKRMGTLRRQAQKAERYRKYKTEMKDIELWKSSHRWLELAGEHSLVSGRLGAVRTELEQVRTEWTVRDATVVAERADLVVDERRLVGVQEKVYELDNKIRLGDSKIGFERREADELEHRIAASRIEIEQVVGQRERGQLELDEGRGELETLESDVSREQGEVREREAAASEARQMLVNAEGRLEATRSQIAQCKTRIATSQAQLESLAQRRGETSGRFERVSGEVEQLSKGTKDLERDLRRVDGALAELRQTRLDLGTQNENFAARRERLATDVAKSEIEVEQLRNDLNRRRSRLQSLEEIQARYEGFARGTRAVMQGAEAFAERVGDPEPIRGVVADVVRAPELLEIAVEAALGDRLGGVLVSNATIGAAAIGYLKEERGGRSAFVPLTTRAIVAMTESGIPALFGEEAVAIPFDGDGDPRGDLSAPLSPFVSRARGSAPIEVIEEDRAGVDLQLKVAAELRARAVVAGLRADAELTRGGASMRARSLAMDATLAQAAITGEPAVDALLAGFSAAGVMADSRLGTLGASLRARVLFVDALVVEPMLADGELASLGASLRAQTQYADAMFAEAQPVTVAPTIDPPRPGWTSIGLALEADAVVFSIGAELRARSLQMDAELVEDEALVHELATMFLAESAPVAAVAVAAKVPNAPFEFEDRSQDADAAALAARTGGDDVVGEGVLGRMVDLVGFADGYEAVGKRLLGRTVVVDHLQRAIELHERGVADRLVTLDGDIVDEDGVVAGGSREAQGAGVLAQKREIRELHEIVGRLEHELSEATQCLMMAKVELAQVTKAIEGLRKQVHEGEVAIVGHEKDDARVRGELERHRDRLGHLAKEQLELEERLATITHDEAGHRERLQQSDEQQRTAEQLQLDLIALLGGHRDRLEELAQVLTEVRVRAAQLEAQRSAVEAATLRLAQTDAELASRVERLRSECDDSGRRATTLRESCEQLASELARHREEQSSESRILEAGRTTYQTRLSALTEIELITRDLRNRGDALQTELGQLELRHGQILMTRKVVEDQVSERYQLEMADVLPEYHQRGLVSDAEDNRLTELRELIDRMGTDINLTAIDEFADVSKRFEFLSAQQIDLERAVEQLQKAIDKINKTSRKLFKDTFTAVNATFKEVFPRLFRGGHAALSLSSEETDILEAGVEIFAQPPGKKNVTVDQLSGGEKALTAVALVFSIFLIKPSPFCILDEVDAPLDEANVDRYNEIVREMTDRSQFIVITHNKRTMEAADNLYGVTMQEPGVSKLVNVNLARIGGGPAERPTTKTITNVASVS